MEKRLLIRDTKNINFENLKQTLIAIQNYKESINEILGIFPFLWFCELFESTCLRLTQICITKPDVYQFYSWFLSGLLEYMYICIINIFYLLAINYFQTHRPTFNELEIYYETNYNTMTSRDLQLNCLMNQKFKSYGKTKYMAFNVFTINLKFLFTFIGSVITFTVMLIQLLSSN